MSNCTRSPYSNSNRTYKKQARKLARILRQIPIKDSIVEGSWIGTVNFNLRKPDFVIIHHTAQNTCDQTLRAFTLPQSQVSAHYVICKDGVVHHMLNDYLRAWHGGLAKWGNTIDINSSSIGIELDNTGFEPFTDLQINSLIKLLAQLKINYHIAAANFIGHADIAPRRKVDPNIHFPWKKLAENGYGLWWNDTTGVQVPLDFNSFDALRILGYDLKDTTAVIKTFKRKYEQIELDSILNSADKKILFSLYKKSL
ncbi:MAG: N-acetylmuramoyl-L-alanine amidase [Flavisolibacter sp.]